MKILGFATGLSTLTVGASTTATGTTSSTYRAPYTYESARIAENESSNALEMQMEPSYHFWFCCHFHEDTPYWNSRSVAQFYSEDNTCWLQIRSDGNETYYAQFYNGYAWVALTRIGGTQLQDTTHRLDLQFAKDGVRLYLNGVLHAYYDGEVPRLNSPVSRITFYTPDTFLYVSGCFASDEDTRKVSMVQHSITADGTHYNEFDGSYDGINNFASLGAEGVSTEVAGSTQTYVASDMVAPFTNGHSLLAVGVYARAATDESGVVNSISTVVSDGTNTAESDDINMDGVMKPRLGIHYTAPDGTAWDVDKFNAAEFGIRTKA